MNQKEAFWNQKILDWDLKRYQKNTVISRRLQHCVDLLQGHFSGARILELGCGTGRILPHLKSENILSYTGVDISAPAVAAANNLKNQLQLDDRFQFRHCDFSSLNLEDYDLVISLGLLDWLTDTEIEKLFSLPPQVQFFHSFSRDMFSLTKLLHQLYVFLSYGYRTQGYVPRYFSTDYFQNLSLSGQIYFVSKPTLQFCQFLTNIEDLRGK